jgi:hypothetical protein
MQRATMSMREARLNFYSVCLPAVASVQGWRKTRVRRWFIRLYFRTK